MSKDDDMSKVMGFSNFGGPKKARQFDFMAMFEESRKTAIERSAQNGNLFIYFFLTNSKAVLNF